MIMVKKILLISGHGAGDSGAVAKIGKTTYKEAEETIVMVKKIKEQLSAYDVTVELYPTERNAYEDAKAGTLKKDLGEYNYVLEIHFNACVNDLKGNGKVTGTEAFVTTYDSTQTTEKEMLSCLKGIGFTNRGVKSHNYTVINRAKTNGSDSCLLEVCFIDDADDMKIYLNNKDTVAKSIALGVVRGLNLKKKSTTTTESKPATTMDVKKEDTVKAEKNQVVAAAKSGKPLVKPIKYVVNAKSGLKLRYAPSRGAEITVMPLGAVVTHYGYYTKVDNVKWLLVSYGSYVGYCSSEFLK